MGRSATGTLFFGFLIPEEECPPESWEAEGDEPSWYDSDSNYVLRKGHPNMPYVGAGEAGRTEFAAHLDKAGEIAKSAPCQVGNWGSGDYPTYYVAVKKLTYCGDWGEAHTFKGPLPASSPGDVETLKAYCTLMDIDFREPAWHIVADYS